MKGTSATVKIQLDNALFASNQVILDIERGNAILDALADGSRKADDPIPNSIVDYLQETESLYGISTANFDISGSCESLWDTVKYVLRKLWEYLCKLFDLIVHCFKYIFSSQYRASHVFETARKHLEDLAEEYDKVRVFERYDSGGNLTFDEAIKIIGQTQNIINFIDFFGKDIKKDKDTLWAKAETVEGVINSSLPKLGIAVKDGSYSDVFAEMPLKAGSYASLGLTVKASIQLCNRLTELARSVTKLSDVKGEIEDLMKDAKARIGKLTNGDATTTELSDSQKILTNQVKMFKFIQACLAILSNRVSAFESLMREVGMDADDVLSGDIEG